MAFDEDPKSKFLCFETPTKLTVALTPPAAVAAYDIRTANDFPARDPTSWIFSCDQEDGTNTVLGKATNHVPPTGRFEVYGPFTAAPELAKKDSKPEDDDEHEYYDAGEDDPVVVNK